MRSLRSFVSILVVGMTAVACVTTTPLFVGHAAAPGLTPTVFGQGAELHLLPLWAKQYGAHISNAARVGAPVRAVGLGFHPGSTVHLIYGVPNAEYVLQPIAQATVDAHGRFDTRFKVTHAMSKTGPIGELLIQAYEGASPGLGAGHAYAVSTVLVYAG